MKANLPPAIGRIISSLLAGIVLTIPVVSTVLAQVPLDPYLASLSVEQRITKAPVFTHRLVYAGDQPPDPIESQALWIAIDVMRANGPGVGIPALELFVEEYPR